MKVLSAAVLATAIVVVGDSPRQDVPQAYLPLSLIAAEARQPVIRLSKEGRRVFKARKRALELEERARVIRATYPAAEPGDPELAEWFVLVREAGEIRGNTIAAYWALPLAEIRAIDEALDIYKSRLIARNVLEILPK